MKRLLTLLITSFICVNLYAKTLSGPAPDFTLKSNDGKNIRLSELKGKVVMINFWATWCAPCRTEMPLLDKLHKRYAPAGFVILGININKDSAQAKQFIEKHPVNFPILFDNTMKTHKVYEKLGAKGMPSSIFIDKDGNMRYLHRGYKKGDEKLHKKIVKELIRE